LDTVGGMLAWRVFALFVLVRAVWGLLTATRLLRREEDAGRWEPLLAGRTTRGNATAQAIAGLAAGWVVLWALTAAFTVLAGSRPTVRFSVSASLFYATAATASAAMFLAIGALTSQLAPTRRQANGLAAAAYAVSFLVRVVAGSVSGLAWMRWASPLGWVENLHPLTGSQPLALVPIVLLVAAASGLAIALANRRDIGAGAFTRHKSVRANTRWLGSPALLVVRLERQLQPDGRADSRSTRRPPRGYRRGLDRIRVPVPRRARLPRSRQPGIRHAQRADSRLDNLLARRLDRGTWLAGRLGFGAALVIAAGLAMAAGGWIGVAGNTATSDSPRCSRLG